MLLAFPKRKYLRSPKLMKAYRTIPCQNCFIDDGTQCGAHSNSAEDGKGSRIKASDDKCATLCAKCHKVVDESSTLTGEQRRAIWVAAHLRTVALLKWHGRWI